MYSNYRRCYFDDFLKYIVKAKTQTVEVDGQKRTIFAVWEGSTSVGENLDPDVEQTVQELKTQGTEGDAQTRYQNQPDNDKLFDDKSLNTFSKIHNKVMDVVDAARKEVRTEA